MTNSQSQVTPKLSVMEIERFALHDGPGIRTVVFLQGCPLHCPWCSNPESWKIDVRLMHIGKRCTGCGNCMKHCPNGAIRWHSNRPHFDRSVCTSCKSCAASCLQNAIRFSGEQMSVTDIMQIVCRDKDYYHTSGGGVTFSGGEAFVQSDGLMALLTQCRHEQIHTAVETCGQVPLEQIHRALPLVDLFLFDIKHTDPALLRQTTGADADVVARNLRYIATHSPMKPIIRVPVIPGFNFDNQSLTAIFTLALDAGITTIHLLPYHPLGKDKYTQLGLTHPYPLETGVDKSELIPYKALGETMGLAVHIGG